MKYTVRCGKKRQIKIDRKSSFSGKETIQVGRKSHAVEIKETYADGSLKTVIINNKTYPVQVDRNNDGFPDNVILNGISYPIEIEKVESTRYKPKPQKKQISGKVISALPGQIISILIKKGDHVAKDQPLVILESMKMENEVLSPKTGVVEKIHVNLDQIVMKGHLILEIK